MYYYNYYIVLTEHGIQYIDIKCMQGCPSTIFGRFFLRTNKQILMSSCNNNVLALNSLWWFFNSPFAVFKGSIYSTLWYMLHVQEFWFKTLHCEIIFIAHLINITWVFSGVCPWLEVCLGLFPSAAYICVWRRRSRWPAAVTAVFRTWSCWAWSRSESQTRRVDASASSSTTTTTKGCSCKYVYQRSSTFSETIMWPTLKMKDILYVRDHCHFVINLSLIK